MAQASAAEVPPVPEDDEGLDEDEAEEPERDEQQEYEEFRRWLRLRDRQGGWSDRRTRPPRRRDDEDDDDGGNDFRTNAGPPPAWDGSQCPFEDYLIRARLWISTTKAKARTRGPLLLKALSDTPFQDFKHLAKDPAWLSNPDNAEALLKKMDSPEYYGDDQDEHLLASLARITYHLKRQKSETARQFLGRWEAAERKVQEHKVILPSLYRGFLMINALGLSDAEIKVLLTFTHGSIEPKDIKTWLRKHETKLQAGQLGNEVASKNKTAAAVHVIEQDEIEENPEDEELGAMEAMLADLAEEDSAPQEPGYFEEDEAAEILAMMIKEKRKTYTQSAQIKKDKELGRGYRQGAGNANFRDRAGPIRPGTYKLSIAELKQRTRCKRCNKFGHWHRECPNPPAAGSSRDSQKETHLLEIDLEPYEDSLFCHYLEAEDHQGPHPESELTSDILSRSLEPKGYGKGRSVFDIDLHTSELDYMPGRVYDVWYGGSLSYDDDACATIDTGCQRTAIGSETLKRMKPFWPPDLQWYQQNEVNKFRSVHGVSQTNHNAVIPCSVGRRGCYMKPAVFTEGHSKHAPFLISLRFLMQSGAIISLKDQQPTLFLTKHKSKLPLHVGPSGALRVPLNQFTPIMMEALRKSERALTGGQHGEFEVLNLSSQCPLECHDSTVVGPTALPPRQPSHGLQLADEQTCQGAGRPDPQERDLRLLAADDLEGRHLPEAPGKAYGEHVQELGGGLLPACQGPPRGDPSRTPTGTSRRREPGPQQETDRRLQHVHAVPRVEEEQEGPGEQQGWQLRDAQGGGLGERVYPRLGVHSLQQADRKPRTLAGNTIAGIAVDATARPTTATANDGTTAYEDAILEPNVDEQRQQQQGDEEQEHGGRPREAPVRVQRVDHGEEGPAGDLHERLPHPRPEHTDLRLPSRVQGGTQRDDPEPQQGVLQLCQLGAAEPMWSVSMGSGAAALGRCVHGDEKQGGERLPERLDVPRAVGEDPPGLLSSPFNGGIGVQRLCSTDPLPNLPKGDQHRAQDDQQPGDDEQQRDGALRRPGVRGLCPVEAGPLLSKRERQRIKGSFQQSTRKWQATFDMLQLESKCSGDDRVDRPPLGFCKKQLGQALNMSDRALKSFLSDKPKPATDMSIVHCSPHVPELLKQYRCAVELAATCLVMFFNQIPADEPTRCARVLGQSLHHAIQRFSRVVLIVETPVECEMLGCDGRFKLAHQGDRQVFGTWPQESVDSLRECIGQGRSPEELAALVRARLATECDVPWQQVHVHDVGEVMRDGQERQERYAHLLDVDAEEIEVMFNRRVRQRREEHQGNPEERELQHDSPEGDGREGDRNPVGDDGPSQIGHEEERELQHDSAEGDGREGPLDDAIGHQREEPDVPGAGVGLDERDLPGSRTRTLRQLVKRAHDGLGHPHRERFLRILKAAKATEEVLQEARNLKCSVCEKFASVRPPRKAAPPREFGINEVIGMDTVWLPTVGQKKKRVALNIIDYSSHFQMMIPLRGRSPEAVWTAYRQWVKFFGPPRQIWADQGSEFKGSFKIRTAQEGTRMDPSSLEAPTQRGLAERHGKTFKVMLEKTMADYFCESYSDWLELIDVTIMVKNRLASRGGSSPIQRVLGYLPRLPGGLLSEGQDDAEAGRQPRLGDAGITRAMDMRKAAAKAFFEVDCDQALRNVLAGGPRPHQDYMVGQMVYFYRLGHSKKGDRPHQRWHGPARIIMTDYPGTIWLSYQGGLVKAAPERIRPGSEEENLTISGWLDGLTQAKEAFEKEPTRGYIDLSNEPLPDLEENDVRRRGSAGASTTTCPGKTGPRTSDRERRAGRPDRRDHAPSGSPETRRDGGDHRGKSIRTYNVRNTTA